MGSSVYIIKSLKTSEYYVGSSRDPLKRLKEHNSGNVFVTKHKCPYELVFTQEFDSVSKARQIESKLKKWKRKDFLEKIIADGKIISA